MIIILRNMRKCTIGTILDTLSTCSCYIIRRSQTISITIHRTITKKAVKILPLFYLVTWKVFTLFILKVTVTVLHNNSPFLRVKNIIFHTNLIYQYWKLVNIYSQLQIYEKYFLPCSCIAPMLL